MVWESGTWSAAAEWVGAVGTVGALIYAARGVRFAAQVSEQDTQDRAEREAYARGAQARSIRSGVADQGGFRHYDEAGFVGQEVRLQIDNLSDDVVRDLVVTIDVEDAGLIRPGTMATAVGRTRLIPPGGLWTLM